MRLKQDEDKIKPGVHYNLGMDAYHVWRLDKTNLAAGPISASMLKSFAVSPYAWANSNDKTSSPAMVNGSIIDTAVTEPHRLRAVVESHYGLPTDLEVAPYDDFRSAAAREWKAEAEAAGLNYVSQSKYEQMQAEVEVKIQEVLTHAERCAKAVREHPEASKILDGASFQVGIIGDIHGIPAKCLVDIVPAENSEYCETLVDLKTTSTGLDDESLMRTIGKFRYHWSAGFYRTLANKVFEDRVFTDFAHIYIDTVTYEVRVIKLSTDALMTGVKCIAHTIDQYLDCAKNGIRSKYLTGADELGITGYTAEAEDAWVENNKNHERANIRNQGRPSARLG
jgi:hypothetical protein